MSVQTPPIPGVTQEKLPSIDKHILDTLPLCTNDQYLEIGQQLKSSITPKGDVPICIDLEELNGNLFSESKIIFETGNTKLEYTLLPSGVVVINELSDAGIEPKHPSVLLIVSIEDLSEMLAGDDGDPLAKWARGEINTAEYLTQFEILHGAPLEQYRNELQRPDDFESKFNKLLQRIKEVQNRTPPTTTKSNLLINQTPDTGTVLTSLDLATIETDVSDREKFIQNIKEVLKNYPELANEIEELIVNVAERGGESFVPVLELFVREPDCFGENTAPLAALINKRWAYDSDEILDCLQYLKANPNKTTLILSAGSFSNWENVVETSSHKVPAILR